MEDYIYEEESENTDMPDIFWGTYAYAPFIFDIEDMSMLDIPMYSTTHYDSSLYYQKEIAVGLGAWKKKPLWDAQLAYVDALHEFWLSGMYDYLASIRDKKEEPTEQKERGIPLTRRKMCERNYEPSL